jgi:hypothetical protein
MRGIARQRTVAAQRAVQLRHRARHVGAAGAGTAPQQRATLCRR